MNVTNTLVSITDESGNILCDGNNIISNDKYEFNTRETDISKVQTITCKDKDKCD